MHTVTREQEKEGDSVEEAEELFEEEQTSVREEVQSFLNAIKGTDDGLNSPLQTLLDVAVIQAALSSEGEPVDLDKLIREG